MSDPFDWRADRRAWILILAAFAAVAALLVGAFAVDVLVAGVRPINKRPPSFAPVDVLRTAMMVAAALVAVVGTVAAGRRAARGPASASDEGWADDRPYRTSPRAVWIVIALAVALTALFLASPPAYTRLGSEGGIIETLSAWFLFACSALLVAAARRVRRAGTRAAGVQAVVLALGAFVFFVIAGEEISWFQRVLDIETPAAFQGNLQNEMNLHNFETNAIEVAYYFAAWSLLVALPFVMDRFPPAREVALLRRLAPDRLMIALAAPMVGYTHDQWNIAPSQLMTFATLFVLVACVRRTTGAERACFVGSLVAFVAIQAAYLTWGHRFTRYWDVTEYREFFIPLALLVWCVQLFRRASTERAVRQEIVAAT